MELLSILTYAFLFIIAIRFLPTLLTYIWVYRIAWKAWKSGRWENEKNEFGQKMNIREIQKEFWRQEKDDCKRLNDS